MACNCKKKVNKKYSEGDDGRDERSSFDVFVKKCVNFFSHIFAALLAIAAIPFAIVWMIIFSMFGKKFKLQFPFRNKIETEKTDAGEP